MATIPFVVFGLFRYLLLVHRDDLGEEPEHVLLTDLPIVVAVFLWVAATAAVDLRLDLALGRPALFDPVDDRALTGLQALLDRPEAEGRPLLSSRT